jgi:hypothetical protein
MNYKGVELVETPLGIAGGEFIRSMIEGETGLAGALARLDFSKGQSFAYLPIGMDPLLSAQFERGFYISMSDGRRQLATRYMNLCRAYPDSALFFHDQWMCPEDYSQRPIERFEVRTSTEVYFCIPNSEISSDNIDDCFRWMTTYYPVGVFADVPNEITLRFIKSPFDESLIEIIAENTREIFMNAYDQESFVIWTN